MNCRVFNHGWTRINTDKMVLRIRVHLCLSVVVSCSAFAAEPKLTPEQTTFFESKIRPVLVENCYKCHSQAADKVKGGLLLDSREGWQKGGDSGPAIVPGNAEKS